MCGSCYQRFYLDTHPEAPSARNWVKNNPEKARTYQRNYRLKQSFGITLEEYEAMWTEQGGKCANPKCSTKAEMVMGDHRKGLQVDHDHKTGAVRALICPRCNTALGHVDDSAEKLAGLIEYLARFS